MANIKDLKKKIKSTQGTYKITSAMKLVSAAKLDRAQGAIIAARPYAQELEKTIKITSALVQNYTHSFFKVQEGNRAILLVISSDKGLCGSYNSGLAKNVKSFLAANPEKDFKVYFIGRKVKELIGKSVNQGEHFGFKKAEPTFDEVRLVAEKLAGLFESGEAQEIYVAYNEFKSAISITPKVVKALPFTLIQEEKETLKGEFPFDFKYEPSATSILDALIPQVYASGVYIKILDSIAAEHGSRMTAMENATKNSKKMIKTLTIKMNKKRQAAITTELIEVVSGAESLNS